LLGGGNLSQPLWQALGTVRLAGGRSGLVDGHHALDDFRNAKGAINVGSSSSIPHGGISRFGRPGRGRSP
jgi:hypothetical protein